MRNSGGSTDNIGHTAKKFRSNPSHQGAAWRSPASEPGSAARLRGADVIDAEFVHIDDNGNPLPAHGPAIPPGKLFERSDQIDFDDDQSARSRRLGLFSGEVETSYRRVKLPVFGFVAIIAVIGFGGLWITGGQVNVSALEDAQTPSAAIMPVMTPVSVIGGDADIAQNEERNQTRPAPVVPSNANGSSGQRTEGSLIYVKTQRKRSVSPSVRSHSDLSISLAGGGAGR